MPPGRLEPRLAALLDDACWLIYRLFGVGARPRIAGLDPRDSPWEHQDPWICHYIHTGEAWNPSHPVPQMDDECLLGRLRRNSRRRFSRAQCRSGLTYLSVPLPPGRGPAGKIILGPYLTVAPSEAGFREFCHRMKIQRWAHMRWAWMQSPVVTPAREKELVGFCNTLFSRIRRRLAAAPGAPWEKPHGRVEHFDYVYPPLRLADDLPLHIYGAFVDRSEMKPGEPEGVEETCHIEYVERGDCTVTVNGKRCGLSPGQMILFLPGDRVRMEPIPGTSSCSLIAISFVAVSSVLAPLAGVPYTLDAFQFGLLTRIVDIAAATSDAAHRNSELKILLAQLLLSCREQSRPVQPAGLLPPTGERTRHGTVVHEIQRYLENSIGEVVRLPAVASHFHMSIPTLRRIFKAEIGLSPAAWRRQQGITRAKLLLRRGRISVTEAARQLGYTSIHYFSHDFKKATGVSPREYARSLQAIDRQLEEARVLLEHSKMSTADISARLGFDSVHSFAQYFKRHVGVSPEEYRSAREKRDASAGRGRTGAP